MPDERIVHVVDDDEAVRDSITFLFESAGVQVQTYASAIAFLDNLPQIAPGCVVTDVRMPDMTGIELLQRLKGTKPALPIIVMTGHGDVPLAVEAMKAGAFDFIEKPFNDETMLDTVRAAMARGDSLGKRNAQRVEVEERLNALSGRERDVLQGLLSGHPNKIIAHNLGISPRTVEIYRANVMSKMEAPSLSDLVRMALVAELF